MDNRSETENRLLFPSLFISQLSSRPVGILMGFILTDIALTYNTSVGIAGQIITVASLAGMVISPFIAALSIKYKPRTLLLTGITLITVSALGCSLAPSYLTLLIFYSLNGLGSSMVYPMVLTIIGEKIPEEKRAGTIGKINSSNPMLSTVAGLTIAYILSGGWQSAYLMFVFPIMSACLIFAFLSLPKTSDLEETEQSTSIREGFNQILGYRSAVACLFGSTLTRMVWGALMWYFVSFYKQVFEVSTSTVGLLWSSNTFIYVIGNLVCGGIISKVGYKRATSISSLIMGVCMIVFTLIPNFYVAVAANLVFSLVAAFWNTGSSALALGQVPEYKGAMMSINSGSGLLGNALGSAFGGLLITFGGYGLMGFFMGFCGFLAFLSVSFLAVDPIQADLSK